MNKLLLSILVLLLLCGCTKEHEETTNSTNNPIANEIVGVYDSNDQTEESTSNTENTAETIETTESEIIPKNYHYTSSPDVMPLLNWDFFIEDNPCVFSDHIVAIVSFVRNETNAMGLEVGSNCYDRSRQGPDVTIGLDDIPIKDDDELNVYDLVNIYYEFPEGFVPESYVDYLNYATLIEKQ